MSQCPNCKRNSLEYNEGKLVAWCLYSDCAFAEKVRDYDDYAFKFEQFDNSIPSVKKKEAAYA